MFHHSHTGFGGTGHDRVEHAVLFRRKTSEDMARNIALPLGPTDADLDPDKRLCAQSLDNRTNTVMTAVTPVFGNTQPAEIKVKIVMDNNYI